LAGPLLGTLALKVSTVGIIQATLKGLFIVPTYQHLPTLSMTFTLMDKNNYSLLDDIRIYWCHINGRFNDMIQVISGYQGTI